MGITDGALWIPYGYSLHDGPHRNERFALTGYVVPGRVEDVSALSMDIGPCPEAQISTHGTSWHLAEDTLLQTPCLRHLA